MDVVRAHAVRCAHLPPIITCGFTVSRGWLCNIAHAMPFLFLIPDKLFLYPKTLAIPCNSWHGMAWQLRSNGGYKISSPTTPSNLLAMAPTASPSGLRSPPWAVIFGFNPRLGLHVLFMRLYCIDFILPSLQANSDCMQIWRASLPLSPLRRKRVQRGNVLHRVGLIACINQRFTYQRPLVSENSSNPPHRVLLPKISPQAQSSFRKIFTLTGSDTCRTTCTVRTIQVVYKQAARWIEICQQSI